MSRFCVMLEIDTKNPRLRDIEGALSVGTSRAFADMRAAIMAVLPRDVRRLVAVFPVEQARLLMMLHDAVGDQIGAPEPGRPPADYVPPTMD